MSATLRVACPHGGLLFWYLKAATDTNSKHWFTTAFLQPLLYIVTPKVPENCQLTSSFFVGAQTVVRLLQTTQIISDICFITDHVAYASANKTKIIWIEMDLSFILGGCVLCLRACLGTRLLPQSYQHPNLLEGADCIGDSCAKIKSAPSVV